MRRWRTRLQVISDVEVFDYDYMREGRKRPDPLPQLIGAHRQALAKASERTSPPIILIGKSMGGRIGCHVSLEEKVDGLVCLGYPLCAMGDRTKLRDKVLRDLTTPILFVQGTRDAFGTPDELAPILGTLQPAPVLHAVAQGDHSFKLSRKDPAAQAKVYADVQRAIVTFVSSAP